MHHYHCGLYADIIDTYEMRMLSLLLVIVISPPQLHSLIGSPLLDKSGPLLLSDDIHMLLK